MFGMSFGEMMVVLVLALVVVGPKNLPKVARQMGKAYAWARHHMSIIQREINLELRRIEMEAEESIVGPNKRPPWKPPDTRQPYEEKEPAAAVPAIAAPPPSPPTPETVSTAAVADAPSPSPAAAPPAAADVPANAAPPATPAAADLSTTGNDLPPPDAGKEPHS